MSKREVVSTSVKYLLVWIGVTFFIALSLIGFVAASNYQKVSGGTCGSVGGQWTLENNIYVCEVIDTQEGDNSVN